MTHLNLIMPVIIVICLIYGICLVISTLRQIGETDCPTPIDKALAFCVTVTCCAMIFVLGWGACQFIGFIVSQLWR